MKYRAFGRTGMEASEIGLGGHREGVDTGNGCARTARFHVTAQERAQVVGRAIDAGVTYFDSTYGCEIESLGQSLRLLGKRDGLVVSGMRVDFFGNLLGNSVDARTFTRREVEGRLRDFGFDHIDQFLLGALDGGDPLSHPRALLDDALDELDKLKKEGKVRFVGFSCHNPDYAARLIETFGRFDSVMTPYNFVNRAAEGRLAEVLRQTGIAWIAMKPLVWHIYGVPVTAIRNLRPAPGRLDFDPTAPIARLALQSVLANPLISTTVPSVNSVGAVDEDVAASDARPLSPADLRHLGQYAAAMTAEEMVPLAIGGLLEPNHRVQNCAIHELCRRLKWEMPKIDPAAADAHATTQREAGRLLSRLKAESHWADLVP